MDKGAAVGQQNDIIIQTRENGAPTAKNELPVPEKWEKCKRIFPWVMGVLIPVILGGNALLTKKAFDEGMEFSVYLFYKNALAALVLFVVAVLSRIPRPAITLNFFLHIIALSILEPVIDQICLFVGLKYTSASFLTCMIVTSPALTFFVSCIFRLEPIKITKRSSQAKVLGMVIMIGGALIVTFYKGPSITVLHPSSIGCSPALGARKFRENWVQGPVLVLVAMVSSVSYNILMKTTTNKYPSPLWLTTFICSIGALINMVVALGLEGRSRVSWMLGHNIKLVCYLYSGLLVSGFTAFLQITLTQMRDPVFLTSFSPISMIFVMVMGAIWLKEIIHVGRILGAIFIVLGLAMLLWGKKHKPRQPIQDGQV